MKLNKIYKLAQICSKIGSGATPKGGKESYLGGNTSLIRSQNVIDFGFLYNGLALINDEFRAAGTGVVQIVVCRFRAVQGWKIRKL